MESPEKNAKTLLLSAPKMEAKIHGSSSGWLRVNLKDCDYCFYFAPRLSPPLDYDKRPFEQDWHYIGEFDLIEPPPKTR